MTTPSESPADLAELKAELEALKKRHPEPEDRKSAREPQPVVCPLCSGSMMPGEATVRGTVLGFLVVGWSYQHLFFRRPGGKRRDDVKVIDSGETTKAWRCERCGAALVVPKLSF